MNQETFRLIFCLLNFIFSLIFCTQGGLYVFDLFDGYSGSIQLLVTFLLEIALIAWVFGIDKLEVLMIERTGERFPMFVKICVKFIIPVFVAAIFIVAWINEFSANAGRVKAGWTPAITWAGRMLMFVPLLLYPIGWFKRIPTDSIDDLILQQYGITFAADGSHTKVAVAAAAGTELEMKGETKQV
jgi:hypothetical protein